MLVGIHGGLKLPDFVLQVRKNPEKHLTKETCPDRGWNPGPLLPPAPQRWTNDDDDNDDDNNINNNNNNITIIPVY